MMDSTSNSSLYGTPDGFERVAAFYDRTIDAMGEPYENFSVLTGSGITHVIRCGNKNGYPLVLWHGQNANSSTWVRWIPFLSHDYCIYAVDTIGSMGKSSPTRLDRKGSAYGAWAAETVKGLGLDSAHMIGASNGGWMILKLSSVAPEFVKTATLISSAGFMPVSLKMVLKIIRVSLSKDSGLIAERMVEMLSPPGMPVDPFYKEFFELILTTRFKSEQIATTVSSEELARVTAPTCILMGQYERTFNPYKAIERALAVMPNVIEAGIVPGVGHSMEHKKPDWVPTRVIQFLDVCIR